MAGSRRGRLGLVAGALVVLMTIPMAVSQHPAACGAHDDDEMLVLIEPGSLLVSSAVSCKEVESGTKITFQNVDIRDHRIASATDSGACWMRTLGVGEKLTVQLEFDGRHLNRTLPAPLGGCDRAIDWGKSNTTHAYVAFECRFHPSFRGSFVMKAA